MTDKFILEPFRAFLLLHRLYRYPECIFFFCVIITAPCIGLVGKNQYYAIRPHGKMQTISSGLYISSFEFYIMLKTDGRVLIGPGAPGTVVLARGKII